MELDHLSYSSISSYLSCAAAWKYHYLDKVPTPTSPELVFGSAFHSTIEEYIKGAHQANLVDLWQTSWTRHVEATPQISWSDSPESYCNTGIRMFTSPEITNGILSIKAMKGETGPVIEKKVELRVPGVPVPIVGYIDIITEDGIPGDFKTSSKSWTSDKAVNEMQPIFYLAALSQIGMSVPAGRFRHFVFVKTKTPQFQIMEHVHKPGEMFWLFGMIRRVWEAIESGCFPPNPSTWKCSPMYCEYWGMCRGKHG
jgi:hypothetical protein